ncbi:MAG: hypothetical protein HYS80_01140 [Candidatus Aenigmarchaeota archaeon]|nr:hypothetical protein [Candidatus Aenigmarchaeota archaeon]
MKRKGISTVISAALIVIIALGLTSTAYIWGVPLIQKRQEASVTERVYSQFSQTNQNSLPKIIEDVANNRGVRTFTIATEGVWVLNPDEDSIEFDFTSKTANIAANTPTPISLTSGVQCTGASPQYSPSPSTGTLGQDSSSVVCASATQGDVFTIKYKLWFRELDDNPFSPTQGFKIDLVQDAGLATSTGKTVKITFGDSTQQVVSGKTLITKKIKILLI